MLESCFPVEMGQRTRDPTLGCASACHLPPGALQVVVTHWNHLGPPAFHCASEPGREGEGELALCTPALGAPQALRMGQIQMTPPKC